MKKNSKFIIVASLIGTSTFVLAVEQPTQQAPVQGTTTVAAAQIKAVTSGSAANVTQQNSNSVMVSPRTGLRYVVNNPANRPIVFETGALQPVTAQNVKRIVATNPALSEKSQQQAEKALLDLAGINAQDSDASEATAQVANASIAVNQSLK